MDSVHPCVCVCVSACIECFCALHASIMSSLCANTHSCVSDRQRVNVYSCMRAHPFVPVLGLCVCVSVLICSSVCMSLPVRACVQKHTSTLFREFLLQQYEFHNAPRHMNEYMYLNVAYISSVGGCAFRFMSAEVYAAFSACILSLQLWFMCVCVCVGASACVQQCVLACMCICVQ